jgi:hypothetical protein
MQMQLEALGNIFFSNFHQSTILLLEVFQKCSTLDCHSLVKHEVKLHLLVTSMHKTKFIHNKNKLSTFPFK